MDHMITINSCFKEQACVIPTTKDNTTVENVLCVFTSCSNKITERHHRYTNIRRMPNKTKNM